MRSSYKGYGRNAGRRWRGDDLKRLRQLARRGLDVREIGLEIGRPDAAIRAKLREIGWSADGEPRPTCSNPGAPRGQLELFPT
jgi:hypothetical protein